MSETILEIAYQFMLEQNKNEKILHGTNERTIFILGSKGVVSFEMESRFKSILYL
jgi:hypothetical protein